MPNNGSTEGENLGQEKYPVCNLAILHMLNDEAEFSCHPLGLTIHTPHCFRLWSTNQITTAEYDAQWEDLNVPQKTAILGTPLW